MGVGGCSLGHLYFIKTTHPRGVWKAWGESCKGRQHPVSPVLGTLQRLSNSLSITCLNHTEQTSPPSPTSFVWSTLFTGHHLHQGAEGLTCTRSTLRNKMHQELAGTAPRALLLGCARSPPTHRDHNPRLHSTLPSLHKNGEHPKGDQRPPRPARSAVTPRPRAANVVCLPDSPPSLFCYLSRGTNTADGFPLYPAFYGSGEIKNKWCISESTLYASLCFIRYTFYSDLWGGPPGRGKHNLTPAFWRGLCLFLLKNH